jgi:hypothetical protein
LPTLPRVKPWASARARVSACFRVDQMGARMERLLVERLDARSARERARATDGTSGGTPGGTADATEDGAADGTSDGAAAIVADLQAQYVPHWRWVATAVAGGTGQPTTLNARAFRSLTMLEPAYRWGLRRGWAWLPALRRRLRGPVRRLLGLDR